MRALAPRLFSALVVIALLTVPVTSALAASLIWTPGAAPFSSSVAVNGVEYGGSTWVAVGASGKISTSSDPSSSWSAATTPSFGSTAINGVGYGNSVWVAVGSSGKLATSTSPSGTWTQRTSSFGTTQINAVAYANGVWVAVGNYGSLATATDPTSTWTQRTSGFGTSHIQAIAYGNGVWVATGQAGKIFTATDPTSTWTQRTSGFTSTQWINSVAYGDDGYWIAAGSIGVLTATTDPTSTWTALSGTGASTYHSIRRANGLWVAVAESGSVTRSASATGPWRGQGAGLGTAFLRSVAYGNSMWTVVGGTNQAATGGPSPTSTLHVTDCTSSVAGRTGNGTFEQALNAADDGDTIEFDATCTIHPDTGTSWGWEIGDSSGTTRDITIDGNGYGPTFDGVDPSSGFHARRGFRVWPGSTLTLLGVHLINGNAQTTGQLNGGSILNEGALTIEDSTIDGGNASWSGRGGNIESNGTLDIERSSITNGTANSSGGGISITGGSAVIRDSTIAGNGTTDWGGGISISGSSTSVLIDRSTISGNNGGLYGGGIYASGADLTITNSTIANNQVSKYGAGLESNGSATAVSVVNSTIAANSATLRGGGLYRLDGTVTFSNSIVSGNSAPATYGPNCYVTSSGVYDGGNNLENPQSPGERLCPFATTPADPLLASLANNGGLTQTMALLTGSPAIGAGDASICASADIGGLDERQSSRNEGTRGVCDIGAYDTGG